MTEQGRTDFYTGANMFVYYSVEQAREVAEEEEKKLPKRTFRGPDVFWVGGVEDRKSRRGRRRPRSPGCVPCSKSVARSEVSPSLFLRAPGTGAYLFANRRTKMALWS